MTFQPPPLFLDTTRIAYRMLSTTPTGIDRVEYAYAKHILNSPNYVAIKCVFTAPFFTGGLRRDLMLKVLDRISEAWRTNLPADDDKVYAALCDYLRRPIGERQTVRRRFRAERRMQHARRHMMYPLRDLVRSPARLRRWHQRGDFADGVYLNTSHNQLETQSRLSWVEQKSTRSVFFVHDTIPTNYPEFVAPGSKARHERRLRNTSRLASQVIANSITTRAHIEKYLNESGLRVPPIHVVPLGVADGFLRLRGGDPSTARAPGHPYFVTLSTIEPRKNLLFLFAVWRRLVEALGPQAPRLVVTGARGWENENISDILERSQDLGPYLVEVSDLCDNAVAELVKGATGLLQPSSVEGFGLPIVEGLTVGVPIIASDIAAHREVGGSFVELISPIDGPRWLDGIMRLLEADGVYAAGVRRRNADYQPLTWSAHVDAAMASIADCG
jgi:glycosyltransferase involved in cell wall biosynthesis